MVSCWLWTLDSERLVSRNCHETRGLLVFGIIDLLSPSFDLHLLRSWILTLQHTSRYLRIPKAQVLQHTRWYLLLQCLLNRCIKSLLISSLFFNLILFILSLPSLDLAHYLLMRWTPWPLSPLLLAVV